MLLSNNEDEVYKALHRYMENNPYSLATLSSMLGICRFTLKRVLTGKHKPHRVTLVKIAIFLRKHQHDAV